MKKPFFTTVDEKLLKQVHDYQDVEGRAITWIVDKALIRFFELEKEIKRQRYESMGLGKL